MRHFLKSKGVLARKGYLPDEPDKRLVKAFEENGEVGPDPKAPRVCLMQTFKGKWNKEVVEVLTAEFISAVNKGRYKHVQHSCPLMTEDEVRKRCRVKLYRTQRMCLLQRKPHRADEDKMNRIMQRRQNVCLFMIATSQRLLTFCRRTTEGREFGNKTIIGTPKRGGMSNSYLMLLALVVRVMMRPTMSMRTQTRASRLSDVSI